MRYLSVFAVVVWLGAGPALAQSGTQIINGTKVFTQIFQRDGVATFSNDCGSQTLTQRELQRGAIPNLIIPCPRPGVRSQQTAPSRSDWMTPELRRAYHRKFMDGWKESIDEAEATIKALNNNDWEDAAKHAGFASGAARLLRLNPAMELVKERIPNIEDRLQYNHCMATILQTITNELSTYDSKECVGQEQKTDIPSLMAKMRKVLASRK